MTPEQIKSVFDRLLTVLSTQQQKCASVESWLRPVTRGFDLPRKATQEHRALADLSRTPWLRLVVDNVVQCMYVDNIVGSDGPSDDLSSLWYGNGLQSGQIANHRAMVAYGHSYGVAQTSFEERARVRFVSPNRMAVEYDALGDPYPSAALEVLDADAGSYRLHLPGVSVDLSKGEPVPGSEMDGLVVGEPQDTGIGFVPVVRFANQEDLDGRVIGEVEPFIPAASRINKTSYDRLLSQHFNSWKVKTATGLELPSQLDEDGEPLDALDEEAAEKLKVKLAQDDILVAEDPETKFGTLDATALDPFVNSWRADIEALAAVSQTPAHALTGMMVNLSAEALAAARAPLTQKVYERQQNASAAYSRLLRAAAALSGWDDIADDDLVRVTWQDMEIRSMAQAVDALGKAAQMLGIPAEGLWHQIPGVEASDVQEWHRLKDEAYDRDPLRASLTRQAESTVSDVSPESGVA
jgi:hypothetical protein